MPSTSSKRIARIGDAVQEALLDLGVSNNELARLSGVSRPTVVRARAGLPVRPDLLIRLAVALAVVELHSEPEDATLTLSARVWTVPENGLPALVAS